MNIRKALTMAFFNRAAIFTGVEDVYKTVHGNQQALISPDSSLVKQNPEWVIYHKFFHANKQYLVTVTAIEADWLIDLPYFQDDRLAVKRNSAERILRQPYVKESLDKARKRREQRIG
jgi:pre-mRNA-splicing factor ATP-dependent RNA helicase DHX15/PRP43